MLGIEDEKMSLSNIEKVVTLANAPILEAVRSQGKAFDEFKKEVQDSQKILNQAIANQQVDRKDLENHKADNKKDMDSINKSISENWKETRAKADKSTVEKHDVRIKKLESKNSWWVGVAAAFGAITGLIGFGLMIFRSFK